MKIIVRLVGLDRGWPETEVFRLESNPGKDYGDMQKAFDYIKANTTVYGLRFGLGGSTITFKAQRSQLRPDVVADIRRVVEAALKQI